MFCSMAEAVADDTALEQAQETLAMAELAAYGCKRVEDR
jgi:hypothetical protein